MGATKMRVVVISIMACSAGSSHLAASGCTSCMRDTATTWSKSPHAIVPIAPVPLALRQRPGICDTLSAVPPDIAGNTPAASAARPLATGRAAHRRCQWRWAPRQSTAGGCQIAPPLPAPAPAAHFARRRRPIRRPTSRRRIPSDKLRVYTNADSA